MSDFVHLHAHSEYSLLDGLSSIKRLTQRAADLGMDSLALTDHGVLYGAVEFYRAAKKSGIKPIIGWRPTLRPANTTTKRRRARATSIPCCWRRTSKATATC